MNLLYCMKRVLMITLEYRTKRNKLRHEQKENNKNKQTGELMNNMLLMATAVQIYNSLIESNISWHQAFEYTVARLRLDNKQTLSLYDSI